jgi:hypothetical protein
MDADSSEKKQIERRRSPRIQILAYAQRKPSDTLKIYYVNDINEYGASLISDELLPLNYQLTLTFNIRLMPQSVSLAARVIRHTPRGFAVEFLNLKAEEISDLQAFLYADLKKRVSTKFIKKDDPLNDA